MPPSRDPSPSETEAGRPGSSADVGFIGIGSMGLAMALRLRESGRAVRVCDIDPRQVAAALERGAVVAPSPAALASGCALVVVVVVDAAQCDEVLFGAQGALRTLAPGACVMLCPTIAPADTEALAARLAAAGIDCIDAPMSGGPARARDGSMSLMVACEERVYERHRATIETLSSNVFRLGARAGDGARTKLVNNLLAAINLAGAAEALALAEAVGLDPALVQGVIERSSGQSWIGSDRMPRALAGDFEPRARTALLRKDSALAIAMAEAIGAEVALGEVAAGLFEAACAAGHTERDDASLWPFLKQRGPSRTDERPEPEAASLDAATRERYAACALASLAQRYPYALQHLMRDAGDRPDPLERHPVFHGSYDWHSSAHMQWSLARLLRLGVEPATRAAIVASFESRIDAEKVDREVAHLRANPGFERPYGWAWLVQLQAELGLAAAAHARAAEWGRTLEPLVALVRARWTDHLVLAPHPQRAGLHANSAFSMVLALAAAERRGDAAFAEALKAAAWRWFGADRRYPARYEPGANDFLSGGLCAAVLMRRAAPSAAAFGAWWRAYRPAAADLGVWLTPVAVVSRTDAQLVHADGLNLSRAWCLGELEAHLPMERGSLSAAREAHLRASTPHVTSGDFVATHWLVSFALLAQTGLDPGA